MKIKEVVPFFTTIYESHYPVDTSCYAVISRIKKEQSESLVNSNRGGWHSKIFNHGQVGFLINFTNELKSEITKIYKTMGINDPANLQGFWIMCNSKYDYNVVHSHPQALMSAVLYLKVPKDSGKLIFRRPDCFSSWMNVDTVTEKSFGTYHFTPEVGSVVIFPSYLEHYVEPNNTNDEDDERICVAFNFGR